MIDSGDGPVTDREALRDIARGSHEARAGGPAWGS